MESLLMDALPEDLIVLIFARLPLPSIGHVSQACRGTHGAGRNEGLWRTFLSRFFEHWSL